MPENKPRDLMATLMDGGVPDRIPYSVGLMPQVFRERMENELGLPLEEAYSIDLGTRSAGPLSRGKPPWDLPWNNAPDNEQHESFLLERFEKYLPRDKSCGLRVSEYGSITIPGSKYHLRRMIYPLERATTLREIDEFPWPDIREPWRWAGVADQIKRYKQQGYWVSCGVGSLYERSWYIRGQQQLLVDTYENPELASHLLDRMTEDLEYTAKRLAEMGADSLACGDDMGHQRQLFMSPENLRDWIISRWERIIGAARAINPAVKIDFHTDGRSEEMLPDLIAVGVTAINPVQPECDDPEHLKKRFGPRLVLKGTLSSKTLTFGSPRDVREEIELRMGTAKRWGGVMITPNNCPDVNTPYENFAAFFDACEKYGRAP